MLKTSLATLGVALALGSGTASAAQAPFAPDDLDALVNTLSESPRDLDGARERSKAARALSDSALSDSALGLPPESDTYRLAGANRYATAVAISEAMVCGRDVPDEDCWGLGGQSNPVTTVFVANGLNFPDALGAGPLASGLGPLLLVPPTGTIPTVVTDEIARIDPEEIVIFGDTGPVSAGVESQLAAYGTTYRIAGADRYETAAIATVTNHEIWMQSDGDGDGQPDGQGLDTIVLASGETFADALAGGGAAANSRGSLLLTARAALPEPTLAALQEVDAPTVIILGDTAVVSTAVESAVRAALPAATVTRVAGADRFATATGLSTLVFPDGAAEVFLVNGYNFPDALASAPLAGYWGASTLLSRATCVTQGTRDEAIRLDPWYATAMGDEGVVSDNALRFGVC